MSSRRRRTDAGRRRRLVEKAAREQHRRRVERIGSDAQLAACDQLVRASRMPRAVGYMSGWAAVDSLVELMGADAAASLFGPAILGNMTPA